MRPSFAPLPLLALALPTSASAATWVVCEHLQDDPACQYATIAEALVVAAPFDVIDIYPGIYTASLEVTTSDLTFRGGGLSRVTVQSRLDLGATFRVLGATGVRFEGMTISGQSDFGPEYGAFEILTGASVTIADSEVHDATSESGAIIVRGSDLVLENTALVDNTATFSGGAVTVDATSSLEAYASTFENNTSLGLTGAGGAALVEGTGYFEECTFSGNSSAYGGHVAAKDGAVVDVLAGEMTVGTADGHGGAIYASAATVDVSGAALALNVATSGGAIAVADGSTLTVAEATFYLNRAVGGVGGAVYGAKPGLLSIATSVLDQNSATLGGGAVEVIGGDLATVTDSILTTNDAPWGGALKLHEVAEVQVLRNTFCDNSATAGDGGATWIGSESYAVTGAWNNNFVIANDATGTGGGIQCENADLEVANNTFVGNSSDLWGGAALLQESTVLFRNNIVAGTVSEAVTSTASVVTFETNDFWANPDGDSNVLAVDRPTDLAVAPLLGDDPTGAECGGDYTLQVGSPVIDAGTGTDLDGSVADLGAEGGGGADPDLWVDADGDGSPVLFDCDDDDASVSPDAAETCDGRDEDCDGLIDDILLYADLDEDGYGDPAAQIPRCPPEVPVSAEPTDCAPADPTIHPGALDVCDGLDQDCSGLADDDPEQWWTVYEDADGDGYGDPSVASATCEPPAGWVDNALDCDDDDEALSPETQWYPDADGDGFGVGPVVVACAPEGSHAQQAGDCAEDDGAVFPGAPEACDDVDADCDGDFADPDATGTLTLFPDADGDGFGDPLAPQTACTEEPGLVLDATDCDDADASVHPGATDLADDDVDQDCDDFDPRSWVVGAGCGCDATAGGGGGAWLLVGLGAALRRRRSVAW